MSNKDSIKNTKIPFKLTSIKSNSKRNNNKETSSPFSIIDADNIVEKEVINNNNINNNNDKNLYDLPIDIILVRTKDVTLEVLDELLQNKFTINSLNKDNRMFFIGVSIILTTILLYFMYELVSRDDNDNNNNGINITYHN
jgi:hypothetical protein